MNDRNDGDDRKRGRGPGHRGERPGGRAPGGAPKREGAGNKPFRPKGPPRREGAAGESAGQRSERPARKPFGEKREGGFGAKRFDGPKRTEGENGGKPFRPKPAHRDAAPGTGGERRFERPRKAFDKGAERPAANDRAPRGEYRKDDRPARPRREDGGEARKFDKPRPERSREPASDEPESGMRIAKRLARAGIASRRDAEGMIADKRVRLNGHLVETPATVVKSADRIEIDGQMLPAIERTRLWLYHKPAGLVTTNRDPEGRPTVFDRLPEDLPRVLTVGRLDINTEGLLLLTNDGGLSRTLELPSTGWLRRYRVRAHGEIKQEQLDELKHGIAVDGVFYGAIEAVLDSEKGANVWMTLGLREGKNREVKRILGHLGLEVNRLIRLSFGPFQLGDLPEGAVREIKGRTLRDQLGPTLIEESGADFDAPIVNPFSNDVVEAGAKRSEPAEPAAPEPRPEKNEWVTARGEAKKPAKGGNRKEFGRDKRESALSRLDTKPDRAPRRDGDAPRPPFKRDGAPKRPGRDEAPGRDERPARPAPGGRRSANVWIAPGGRPLGEQAAARKREREREREESGDAPARGDAKPFRSRGFRDAPAAVSRAPDGDKPRRSAGFRSQSEGRSFGDGEKKPFAPRAGRPSTGDKRPFNKGGPGGGKPGGGNRRPPPRGG